MPRAAFPSGRKSLLLLALVTAGIGGAWWWVQPHPPFDPESHGQRLSEWLYAHYELVPIDPQPDWSDQLRAFGPVAVPWLLYNVEHGTHRIIQTGPRPFAKAPPWLRALIPDRWGGLYRTSLRDDRCVAANALGWLGPDAAPAIPTLAKILASDEYDLPRSAAFALQSIGPAAWPAVQEALDHDSTAARNWLVLYMRSRVRSHVGIASPPAPDAEVERIVEALVKACDDPDANLRCNAAFAIATCQSAQPGVILSAPLIAKVTIRLRAMRHDPDAYCRKNATAALKMLGLPADDPDADGEPPSAL